MKNLYGKFKSNPFKILMVTTLIYPVLPLALIATWASIIFLVSFFIGSNSTLSPQGGLWLILALILFLGGPAGLVAGIYALLNKASKKIFWFFLYGAFSYSFIAIPVIIGGVKGFNLLSLLHVVYLLMTLVVIIMTFSNLYNSVYKSKKTIEVKV